MGRRRVTIYLKPITKMLNIDDDMEDVEIEMEETRQIFDVYEDEILNQAEIDYWEEG